MLEEIICIIAERIAARVLHRTEQELKRMTDQAVTNLTNAVDGTLTQLTALVTAIQNEAASLAAALAANVAAGTALDPAIQAEADRLTVAAGAAAAALADIQPPPAPPAG